MSSKIERKATKELRAAASELKKLAAHQQSAKRSRKGRSRRVAKAENRLLRNPHPADVSRYVQSLYHDILAVGCKLPSTNYSGPYRHHTIRGRVQLNLANTASLHGSIVVNPWLAFMENFFVEKESAGADQQVTLPTIYQHTFASSSTGLPFGDQLQSVPMVGRISNTFSDWRAGFVRCKGVHFRVTYAGTWNNRGGTIYCFTNPGNSALLAMSQGGSAGASRATGWDTAGEIDANIESVQVFPLNEEFCWTWRPTDLDFRRFEGAIPFEEANVASGFSLNPRADDYIPSSTHGSARVDKGWVTGFDLRPAAGTQGAVSQYFVDIEIDYDISEAVVNAANQGAPSLIADQTAYHDPVAVAQIQNHLAVVHQRRKTLASTPGARNMSLIQGAYSTAKREVLRIGRSVAMGAAEEVGSRLSAMLV